MELNIFEHVEMGIHALFYEERNAEDVFSMEWRKRNQNFHMYIYYTHDTSFFNILGKSFIYVKSEHKCEVADKLGPVLKELYIDAKHILPALLKLEQLEVLSVTHNESVYSFIIKFVVAQGQKMKELVLANCTQSIESHLKKLSWVMCNRSDQRVQIDG
uniref:Leucine-rich repeat, cysteine-containing subtype n=1 Tax=Tanacetum cinerariifolium TaxID=118510 RepID=A0A6L2L3D4_TANCI|nr:leucine-rich repeat, cysteine-containing subtype [Tanacetum cinerariifolium]